MARKSVTWWVALPFLALCALGLWLTRPRSDPAAGGAPAAPAPPPAPAPRERLGPRLVVPPDPAPAPEGAPVAQPSAAAAGDVPAAARVDPADVRTAIEAATPLVRRCFLRMSERYPGPQSVTLRFTVVGQGLTGHLSDGEVVESSVQDPLYLPCFLEALVDVRFPAPRGGGSVTVTYPFRFVAGGGGGDGGA